MNKNEIIKEIFSLIKTIVIVLLIVVLLRHFIVEPYIVEGESMMPRIEEGDRILTNKFANYIERPERFDVVIVEAPDSDQYYIKRIIGLPGDKIEYKEDKLYVNGKEYEEAYLKDYKNQVSNEQNFTKNFKLEEITDSNKVPKNHYFILGDNRDRSHDSRAFGYLSEESVVGEAAVRFWPLEKVKLF